MVTKFNIGDEIYIKATVTSISIGKDNSIEYRCNFTPDYGYDCKWFLEDQLCAVKEDENEEIFKDAGICSPGDIICNREISRRLVAAEADRGGSGCCCGRKDECR